MANKPNASRARRAPSKPRRDWKTPWLAAFLETGMVTAACKVAKVSRTTVYDARSDEQFAVAWDEIEAQTTDKMEREAYRRAVEGVRKPLVSAGKHVTDVIEYSDGLLTFMLKARKPDVYRDNVKVEHAGRIDGKHVVEIPDTADRRQTVVELLAGAGLANGSPN